MTESGLHANVAVMGREPRKGLQMVMMNDPDRNDDPARAAAARGRRTLDWYAAHAKACSAGLLGEDVTADDYVPLLIADLMRLAAERGEPWESVLASAEAALESEELAAARRLP